MSDQPQNYASHRRWVPAYHFVLSLLILAILIGSVVNVVKSAGTPGMYSATLILAMSIAMVLTVYYVRAFPLRAQDRLIRLEENFRSYIRNGSFLDSKLDMRQIIGLRFASDEEFDALMARAVSEGMSEDEIKKAIKHWRSDSYRV